MSERFNAGPQGELHDTFGNAEYSSSQTTAVQKIVNYLNDNRLGARGLATAQNPGAPIEHRFQRFARLKHDFVEQKTPEYVPVQYRAG